MTTNILNINTHPISFPKKQTTIDSGYHSADELSYTSSPTTTNSMISSRRSSFSSCHTNNRQSLPPSQRYTTLKSAHERIEVLEEQIRSRKESNETIVKGMNYQIDTFFKNYNNNNNNNNDSNSIRSSTDSSLTSVINVLNELKNLVSQHDVTIIEDTTSSIEKIKFSTQTIDNWIQNVTQHKTKEDLQNVPTNKKYHKIVKDIQKLSKEYTITKKQLKKSLLSEQKNKLKLQEKIKENKSINQDKIEIEQLLDEIRNEMETMMEELNHFKLEKDYYFEKSIRFESDLKRINENNNDNNNNDIAFNGLLRESENQIEQLEIIHTEQITKHQTKINSLETQLEKAKRSIAELSLLLEVQKRQNPEMEQALRRTLAERDGELAKLKLQFEKNLAHIEHIKSQQENQLKLELNTHIEAIEFNLKENYKKETDTFMLHVSRKVRESAGKILELETELDDYHRQYDQFTKQSVNSQSKLKKLQSSLDTSHLLTANLEAKIKVLESEVLLLYGKNLELAQHLGELDE